MNEPSRSSQVKDTVRDSYRQIALEVNPAGSSCCPADSPLDYSPEELASVPPGAILGQGSGNPTRFAAIRTGETVVDLGCGAGMDVFLAAHRAGPTGRVVGVDFTPEMLERAERNRVAGGYRNVEFRPSDIEGLPLPDGFADLVISNCVINLAPDKRKVYREVARVLKPSGRISIADVVLRGALPEEVAKDPKAYCGCVAGAIQQTELETILRETGFAEFRVHAVRDSSTTAYRKDIPAVGITFTARKA